MPEAPPRRLLIVANLTESAPQLLDEVTRRARDGWQIALMIPPERDPDAPDWTPEEASRLVRRAADDQPVTMVDCGEDAAATIGAMAERGEFDEILLSTPPEHHEHWHRHTLPRAPPSLRHPGDRHPARQLGRVCPYSASRRSGLRVRSARRRRSQQRTNSAGIGQDRPRGAHTSPWVE